MHQKVEFVTSTASGSFFKEGDPVSFYGDIERKLDNAVAHGKPDAAYEIEEELLFWLDRQPYITNVRARATMKAIAVSQYSRQHETSPRSRPTSTYRSLGKLAERLISTIDRGYYSETLVGTLSETAVYTLLAYDDSFEYSLTGCKRILPVHYTLPATRDEDRGTITESGINTGFDLKLFTNNPSEAVLPLQVKTSRHSNEFPYRSDISVIHLTDVLPENRGVDRTLLASYIAQDAAGELNPRIDVAVRNLEELIIENNQQD